MFLIKYDFWEIRKTENKGLGVFAKKEIKKSIIISDYLGKVIKTAEYDLDQDRKGLYLMYYSDEASIYPDLNKPGPHLLNHSCEPNCFMYTYRGHTLFFTLRKINPGEEFTISYLLSPGDDCDNCPHVCNCNSKSCTGTMHLSKEKYKKWQEFQASQKGKVSKVTFDKNLPKLTIYPKTIPSNQIYNVIADN